MNLEFQKKLLLDAIKSYYFAIKSWKCYYEIVRQWRNAFQLVVIYLDQENEC